MYTNIKGVKYTGPVMDISGYGEAARNYVLAINSVDIPLTVQVRRFDTNTPETVLGNNADIIHKLENNNIDFDVNIVHLTPDLWPQHFIQGKYNIGVFAWETGKLPPLWVGACNKADEVWVPSDYNVSVLKQSGVTSPVYKIRHGIDINTMDGITPLNIGIDKDTFVFYSIFQWIYRKNPEGLLRAYYNAFKAEDNVVMIVKSYMSGSSGDAVILQEHIESIKHDMRLSYYPKILLIPNSLSRKQLLQLHILGDCYVSMHRGEGFGLPLLEAGLAGNALVATGYSGNLEFMTKDNSYLVPYTEAYVSRMSGFNPWYLGDQVWAEPSTVEASVLMHNVYINRKKAVEKGILLKKNIVDGFSWNVIASSVIKRLETIQL